jgi:sulfate transport system permease protein
MSVTTERRPAAVPVDARRLRRVLGDAFAARWPGVSVFTLVRRAALIALTLTIMTVLLLLPLLLIFTEALSRGWRAAGDALAVPEAWAAIRLTLTVAALAVPVNAVFGTAAAWCIGRFRFPDRTLLMTLIELPLEPAPVV